MGETDDKNKHFDANNNFYYCPNESLDTSAIPRSINNEATKPDHKSAEYTETVARCTGNDRFDAHPQANDWYETIKLNYGIDYCDWGGRSNHFNPIPDTWHKNDRYTIVLGSQRNRWFSLRYGRNGATRVWKYATEKVKAQYPHIVFIGEVYDPNQYRKYIAAGFDYLYDKVGMYDCLRDVMCEHRSANDITRQWQATDVLANTCYTFLKITTNNE